MLFINCNCCLFYYKGVDMLISKIKPPLKSFFFLSALSTCTAFGSNPDYEWDSTKIIVTAAATSTFTLAVAPNVIKASKKTISAFGSGIQSAYERSSIGPGARWLWQKSHLKDAWEQTAGFLLPGVSHRDMPIDEVLSSTMHDFQSHHLREIDRVLSEGITESQKISAKNWMKSPIFGHLENSQMSFFDCFTCKICSNEDYLYGYQYENGEYLVKLHRYFDLKSPEDIEKLDDFYKINPYFKEKRKGIRKHPKYSPRITDGRQEQHPYVNAETIQSPDIEGIKKFLKGFLESFDNKLEFYRSKKRKAKNVPDDLKKLDGAFKKLLNLSQHATQNINLVLRTQGEKQHLYFLFPSQKDENQDSNYSIMLHLVSNYLEPKEPTPVDSEASDSEVDVESNSGRGRADDGGSSGDESKED
jgi:hypothetical protein